MSKRSRLYRNLEKESRKNLTVSILGIVIILFLLLRFGPPLLVNFALFISGTKQNSLPVKTVNFLMQPQVDPLPGATNSAKFTLTGKAEPSSMVSFYLNDILVDKTQTDNNGKFSFDSLFVKGENKIYVLAKLGDKISSPSETVSVLFKDSNPNITISSPSDGQQFSKDQNEVNVSGSTDPNVKITINGFWAIVDQSNNFSYKLKLQNGDNTIKIEAEDQAGNKTEKEVKVKYSST